MIAGQLWLQVGQRKKELPVGCRRTLLVVSLEDYEFIQHKGTDAVLQ